jgi:hypothetical protein|tara:strand:+ start:933 stop:1193 length:261 start_codon:yes stop_codon:yes gene_type:complete
MIKNRWYKLWVGYGEHKWWGKWGDGKDWRWYLYRLWLWIGTRLGYASRYMIERDKALVLARKALERAFSPQLKKMLESDSTFDTTE